MRRNLMEPFRLGPVSLKNRLVFAPITTQYADEQGRVTKQLKAHYEARARGGAGLIIVEATYVEPVGQVFVNQLGIHHDHLVSGLSELAGIIKKHGCVPAIQLHHGGRMAKSSLTGMQPVAPSAIAHPAGEMPRELSQEEIRDTIDAFVTAAARAREAGFVAAELHGAHGYLIDQFLSGAANRRTDAYGGSIDNRARFLDEILQRTVTVMGPGFPVWVRMNGREYGVEGGTTLDEALQIARVAERAGSGAIHVSAYGPSTPTNRTTAVFKPAVIADLAAAMKRTLSIPVMAVGRITPAAAEEMIAAGSADLIVMGKALLADASLPTKVASGRENRIVPCIVCMHCRDSLLVQDTVGIRCQVNPRLGRDEEAEAPETAKPRRVLVVGGGPAGIVAALNAAERGHLVTLWEKSTAFGGQLSQAAVAPHKDRIRAYAKYLENELIRTGVNVELEREASVESVIEEHPGVVILATGPRQTIPDVPGIDKVAAIPAGAVLDGSARVGKKVVIVGGELVGCEVAEYLAELGKSVVVTRRGPEMALKVGPSLRPFVLERLRQKGVRLLPGVTYVEARPGYLDVQASDGRRVTLEMDSLVFASGSVGESLLHDGLRGKIDEVYMAGDCVAPRSIGDAVREGYDLGSRI